MNQPVYKFATQRLLDSVWTLKYVQVEIHTITIISYSRDDQYGYDNEKSLDRCRLCEQSDRTVIAVQFGPYEPFTFTPTEKVLVLNPLHVFSYSQD